MKRALTIFIFQLMFAISFGQAFKVGDKVEIYNSGGWYKGSILEIGSGNYNGYYSVHYDQYSQPQWMKASNIRLQKNTVTANTVGQSPRNGEYIILSYGNPNNPIRLGYFQLKAGEYKYYDMARKLIGQGSYSFDSNTKTVAWKSGPFKSAQWGGAFEINREGKTHTIRLNRVTIGTNSTDSN